MKLLNKLIIPGLLVMAVACSQPETQTTQEELVRTINVEAQTLETRPFERHLRLVGTVKAQNDVRISAEVAGRIQNYFVERGDRVEAGDPIAKIDDSQLVREQQRLESVTAQARENYERLQRLYEEQNIGSEIDYLNARYNYEQNRAALESVNVSIEKTTVTAPFNATVENVLVEAGEMVSPGTVMVRLIGSDRLKVSTGVPSRFADVINRGDQAQVWFDFTNRDTLSLPITFVGSSIDQQARTFEVEIRLPAQAGTFKVDMIANVLIRTLNVEDVLVISEEFIYQKEGGYVVYIVAENGDGQTVAREVPVTLGASYRNSVVVENGLNGGDRLITVGSSFLQDNVRINVVESRSSGIAQSN